MKIDRHSFVLPFAISAVIAMAMPAFSQSVPVQHARVQLISEEASVRPGAELLLGVRFLLDPGWHIYWINPGDSGQPPAFQWQLPQGFEPGEIRWPRPERLAASQLVDYGYKDRVLFMVPVHVPKNFSGSQVPIKVNAKWLICREICIPDKAQLDLALPLLSANTAEANPATKATDAALFKDAKRLLPRDLPRTWKTRAQSTKDGFVLTVLAGSPIRAAIFFPREPGQIENAAPQSAVSTAGGVGIRLKKSDVLTHPISMLRGVLEVAGDKAYNIAAPVQPKTGSQ